VFTAGLWHKTGQPQNRCGVQLKRGSKVLGGASSGKWVRSSALLLAAGFLSSGFNPLIAAPAPRPFAVEHYDVSIQADPAQRRLNGEESVRVHTQSDEPISVLELDAGGLEIASVEEGHVPLWFERKGERLLVVLASPLRLEEHRTITIRYQAGPSDGLRFFADQVYGLSPENWMPCNDRPGELATLHFTLAAPADFKAAASGQLVSTHAAGGQNVTEWQLDRAAPPALFGFAGGSFAENTSASAAVKLRVLGGGADVFDPTTAALRYLTELTGKTLPGPTYTQVFVHGDALRSLAGGLAFLPDWCAQGVGKDADKTWLLARALAGQWYGVGIVPKDWSDVWLSEGISAFLSDTFLGQRFGEQAEQAQLERSQQIYNRLRTEGKDRTLSDSEWTDAQDADGDIPLHKGVLFLRLVHQMIGDTAFWERLGMYTGSQWGKAPASEDFQNAYAGVAVQPNGKRGAKRAGKNEIKSLNDLFNVWVYGIPTGTPKGKRGSL
jgi:aminopeptidase N